MNHKRNLFIAFSALISVFLIGVIGYSITERNNTDGNWTVFNAIFMTVITLTTVGYDDGEMSNAGRVFTVFLLIGGFANDCMDCANAPAVIESPHNRLSTVTTFRYGTRCLCLQH